MKTEKEIIIKTVGGTNHSGATICLPKFLIGKEIEIRFKRNITEEEKVQLKRYNLLNKLKELRKKRGDMVEKIISEEKQIITLNKGVGKLKYSLKEALGKTYEIRGWEDKNGSARAILNIPTILIGHKVKLVLVK